MEYVVCMTQMLRGFVMVDVTLENTPCGKKKEVNRPLCNVKLWSEWLEQQQQQRISDEDEYLVGLERASRHSANSQPPHEGGCAFRRRINSNLIGEPVCSTHRSMFIYLSASFHFFFLLSFLLWFSVYIIFFNPLCGCSGFCSIE